MTKQRVEADIVKFKGLVENSTVEDVDTPAGRKDVEIAYDEGRDFIVEEGQAIGVYWEPSRMNPVRVHIDWADDMERTTVEWSDVETFEESDYYNE